LWCSKPEVYATLLSKADQLASPNFVSQWEVIEKMLASKRVRQHSLRLIRDLILWIVYQIE
jgi:hypothetical protein